MNLGGQFAGLYEPPMTPEEYELRRRQQGGAPTQITVSPLRPPTPLPVIGSADPLGNIAMQAVDPAFEPAPPPVDMDQWRQATKAQEDYVRAGGPAMPPGATPKGAPQPAAPSSGVADLLSAAMTSLFGKPGTVAPPSAVQAQPLPAGVAPPEEPGVYSRIAEALPTPTTPIEMGARRAMGGGADIVAGDLAGALVPGGSADASAVPFALAGGLPGAPAAKGVLKTAAKGKKIAKQAVATEPSTLKGAVVTAGQEFQEAEKRARAITDHKLRELPIADAIIEARKEPHIIIKKDGTWVGAPKKVRSRADLEAIRNEFDQYVALGAEAGAYKWYEKARGGYQEMTAFDPSRSKLAAEEAGLFSSQATVNSNLGFQLGAHNAFEVGKPLDIAHTGRQGRTYRAARETGSPMMAPEALKTDPFAVNLDFSRPFTTVGVNDVWHGRALGYEVPSGGKSFTPQQHAFMDFETVLAADRAGQRGLGGKTSWIGPEVQASAWVGKKAADLMAKGMSKDEALKQSVKDFSDFFEKYTAYGTTDAAPGQGTRHLPKTAHGSPEVRADFADDPRSTFSRPNEFTDKPYDVYHKSQGLYQRPTVPTTGVFSVADDAPLEVNKGEAARSMVGTTGPSGERTWDPASLELLRAAEAYKAYINAQNMGAASMLMPGNKAGRLGSIEFDTPGQLSDQLVNDLTALGKAAGRPHLVHYGDKAVLTDFAGNPSGTEAGKMLDAPGGLGEKLAATVPGANPRRTELISTNIDYSDEWARKEGTGAVTRKLFENLSPHTIQKFDASPEIRADILGKMNRDIEQAAKTDDVLRKDLQEARGILVKDGLAGLAAALAKGAFLPAVGAMVLRYLPPEATGQTEQRM